MNTNYLVLIVLIVIGLAVSYYILPSDVGQTEASSKATKLYWFIPDGVRAEPDVFNIYKWAEEGRLPNIKKLMDEGTYGFSIPAFPSHTPTNFATLLTGTYPLVHGVADGPMHIEGFPLDKPSIGGFSSVAKKVSPIWINLENAGKKVLLLSIPGSTPPELDNGITIRGRWGGWGIDTHKVIYEDVEKLPERKSQGRGYKLFFLGSPLTKYIGKMPAVNWTNVPQSYSSPLEAVLESWGLKLYAYIYDSTDDNNTNYNRIAFSEDKKEFLADISQGNWTEWIPTILNVNGNEFDSDLKIKVIKLENSGVYRIRILYNNMNRFITHPSSVSDVANEKIGPMVDFADNWPPQLIHEAEDKQTFLDEAEMSFDWHRDAVSVFYDEYNPDVFIQDVYTPNQMMESRWWHRFINESSPDYIPEKANESWDDLFWMYKKLDDILGEAIKKSDENTLIVFSSDHGNIYLQRIVKLNNLFAKHGWLKFTIDNTTGEPVIDWDNTKVIYLKMAHIYVNPKGLGGNWTRASGAEYESLRNEVINVLKSLEDDGTKPVVNAVAWEDAPQFFELSTDRIGDIVIEANPGYFWTEEMSNEMEIFVNPLTSGYKQTVDARTTKGMWTPFILWGPGVKKGFELKEPINHVDQMPTILSLMNIDIPDHVQGRVLTEAIE